MKTQTKTQEIKKDKKIVGTLITRGRTFFGEVTKKLDTRVVVEFERTVRIQKYERFTKKKTKLHARIPTGLNIHVGDTVKIQECRPLSKIIHFQVVEIVKEGKR